ncbi:F0F1 ATP synthase subunit delta [Methylobacter tundripaludum]|jgi:ATP synthase, F1 delta subunit|uniref:ATP synthase subunit delta n=2 Tax=Methylobacter tundripaludum TaxID=173365 RepID=G3IWU8_METTV|nr:F0F1 ATP synthase subunit delta [Methylobacter tundripaludum]EGW23303.1 ATP synthase subunit delta [Methylobacter tundripaludum SV96]MDD4904832.1 F0F1 ATP synthase subunit delta [Methylobacter tundripaludum]PPK78124.1 F-type H+-transporting ATPase subunit delta [Methylobacter tundripaludum]
MSELATLARPYAAAVFKRSKETGTTEQWSKSLAFISAVLNDKEISVVVDNPKVSSERLSALMLDICQGQVDEEGANFLKLLVQNNRLTLAPTIAELFEAYKAESEGYVDVEVATAYAFTKEEKQRFTSTLEKTLSKKVHMNVTVDKSLIGGVLVRAGDRVIDGSIKGQLQQLAKRL